MLYFSLLTCKQYTVYNQYSCIVLARWRRTNKRAKRKPHFRPGWAGDKGACDATSLQGLPASLTQSKITLLRRGVAVRRTTAADIRFSRYPVAVPALTRVPLQY